MKYSIQVNTDKVIGMDVTDYFTPDSIPRKGEIIIIGNETVMVNQVMYKLKDRLLNIFIHTNTT